MLDVLDPIVEYSGGDARMPQMDAEPFGRWLGRQLKLRRMSQRQLAARSGVSHSTVSRLVASDRQPSLATATKIARVFSDAAEATPMGHHLAPSSLATDPVARVERALRADYRLSDAQVRRLMFQYLSERREEGERASVSIARLAPPRSAAAPRSRRRTAS